MATLATKGFIDLGDRASGEPSGLSGLAEYQWFNPSLGVNGEHGDEPDKPILVLLHEGLGCVALWKSFPQALAEKTGCSVFCYSRFGYGQSSACALPRNVDYMHQEAHVLGQILQRLPKRNIVLIGHSDGASIATIFAGNKSACQAPDHPIQCLVLMAPHFFVESVSIEGIRAAKKAFVEGDLRPRLEKYHGSGTDIAFWGWNDIWLSPEFIHWNIVDQLSRVRVPIQILQGEDDQYGTFAQIEAATQHSPRSLSVHIYPKIGHNLPLAHGETVIGDIQAFLGNLP